MAVIGIDTSNYTTSIAFLDGEQGENCGKLLPVKQGELGLRQSDAVFAIKGLPELSGRLFSHIEGKTVTAVGVSTRPRAVEGSYMPCFLVGYSHAKLLERCLPCAAGGGFPPAGGTLLRRCGAQAGWK